MSTTLPVAHRGFGMGWIPSNPAHPDAQRPLTMATTLIVPDEIDLFPLMGPVLNQGPIGCCTAAAVSSLVMHAHLLEKQHDFTPSMLFNYWFSRKRNGWQTQDIGSTCANALASAVNEGICAQDVAKPGQWVFDPSKVDVEPTPDAIEAAQHHKADWYWSVLPDPAHISQVLARGYPVSFGMTVYPSFWDYWQTGVVPLPGPGEVPEGGHSMAICGRSAARQAWLIKNSWGPLNPTNTCPYPGYLWLPWAYPVSDLWTIARESA